MSNFLQYYEHKMINLLIFVDKCLQKSNQEYNKFVKDMKQGDYLNGKINFQIRKRPINAKLFQNQKNLKDDFIINTKMNMGKKYMQEHNIFKQRHDQPKKQHRQIVMSQQFIKSSKLYRLLKQKMDRNDSQYIKQVNMINEDKLKLKQQINVLKSQTYQQKVSLWQMKNKLMQLKLILHQQQQQSKRLNQQNIIQYQDQQEQQHDNQDENPYDRQQNQQLQQNQHSQQQNNFQYHQDNQNDQNQQYQNNQHYQNHQNNQNYQHNEHYQSQLHQHQIQHNISLTHSQGDNLQNEVRKDENFKEERKQFSQILKELMNLKDQHRQLQHKQNQNDILSESNSVSIQGHQTSHNYMQ